MDFPDADKPVVISENGEVQEGKHNPKIEFPTWYPIKIVGDASDSFEADMLEIVARFDPRLKRNKVTSRDSRNGRFRSIRLKIYATGEQQLKDLFEALKATGRVHMVI